MNKYQEHAFKQIKLSCISENKEEAKVRVVNDSIKITQNENYNIVKYDLIFTGTNIKKIEHYTNKRSKAVISNQEAENIKVPISFDDLSPSKIKVTFVGDLVDPIEFKLEYVSANKEARDQKNKEQLMADYESNLNLISTSDKPVSKTLYFKLCSNLCKKTIIEWYVINREYKQVVGRNAVSKQEEIVTKYLLSVDEITDNRCYSNCPSVFRNHNMFIGYVLKQYDSKGELLIEVTSKWMI